MMKLFLAIILFSAQAFGLPQKRQLSFLSVVSFPNDECQAVSDTTTKGTCLTSTECSDRSGSINGNCASGFGVCCVVTLKACGGDINKNITYVQNDNYPSSFTTNSKTCTYKIYPAGEGICQLRLDFDIFVLNDPVLGATDQDRASNTCGDTFTVVPSAGGKQIGSLCGSTLTGSHMYVEVGDLDSATTMTIATGTVTGSRKWNIKVAQIECEATYRAPHDCTQYYTGASGTFSSFNHPNYLPREIIYTICIRQEAGACNIAYSLNPIGTNDAFELTPRPGTTKDKSKRSATCPVAVVIRTDADQQDLACNRRFASSGGKTTDGTVYSDVLPFNLLVFYDADAGTTTNTMPYRGSTGFSFKYQQQGCGKINANLP